MRNRPLTITALCLAMAQAAHASDRAGKIADDSLFGPINYGHPAHVIERTAPKMQGGYSRVERELQERTYVSSHPKGGMYLMENTLHNCKQTLHIAIDQVRGPKLEQRLGDAATKKEMAVRMVVSTPQDQDSMGVLQRLMRLGVEVRYTPTPILSPFSVCDSEHILRGVHEPYDAELKSFGESTLEASYENASLGKTYEIKWQNMWGKAEPLPMSTEPGNKNWELFGKQLQAQNSAILPYQEGQLIKEYNHRPFRNQGFFEIPFEMRKSDNVFNAENATAGGDATKF